MATDCEIIKAISTLWGEGRPATSKRIADRIGMPAGDDLVTALERLYEQRRVTKVCWWPRPSNEGVVYGPRFSAPSFDIDELSDEIKAEMSRLQNLPANAMRAAHDDVIKAPMDDETWRLMVANGINDEQLALLAATTVYLRKRAAGDI